MSSRKDRLANLPKNEDGSVQIDAGLLAELERVVSSQGNADYNKMSNASKGIIVKRHRPEFDSLMAYFKGAGVDDDTKAAAPAFSEPRASRS